MKCSQFQSSDSFLNLIFVNGIVSCKTSNCWLIDRLSPRAFLKLRPAPIKWLLPSPSVADGINENFSCFRAGCVFLDSDKLKALSPWFLATLLVFVFLYLHSLISLTHLFTLSFCWVKNAVIIILQMVNHNPKKLQPCK